MVKSPDLELRCLNYYCVGDKTEPTNDKNVENNFSVYRGFFDLHSCVSSVTQGWKSPPRRFTTLFASLKFISADVNTTRTFNFRAGNNLRVPANKSTLQYQVSSCFTSRLYETLSFSFSTLLLLVTWSISKAAWIPQNGATEPRWSPRSTTSTTGWLCCPSCPCCSSRCSTPSFTKGPSLGVSSALSICSSHFDWRERPCLQGVGGGAHRRQPRLHPAALHLHRSAG